MRIRIFAIIATAGLLGTGAAHAQHSSAPGHDPVRLKYADQRQYRGEPRSNARKRDTRCRIVVRRGQDKRVCGTPTNYALPRK